MMNLSDVFNDATFALDYRNIEQTLHHFKAYTSLIPFEEDSNQYWDQMFFPKGDADIERLVALYRNPEMCDGKLPPQQAFLLAFLRQMETPQALFNTLPAVHRQLYYRDLLGLKPRLAKPDQVVLSFNLAPGGPEHFLPAGTAMDAGMDSQGLPLHYLLDRSLQANAGLLSDVRWCRPSGSGQLSYVLQAGEEQPFPEQGLRLFTPIEQEQVVTTGRVVTAEVLALSSGQRTLKVTFDSAPGAGELFASVSGENVWLALPPFMLGTETVTADFTLNADQPAVVPPIGLDGFTGTVPLLKLSRADGIDVPKVISIRAETILPADIAFSTQDGGAQLDQACLPFGSDPLQGACIRLMAPDFCRKSQEITVTVTPVWQGLPTIGFKNWYANYSQSPQDNKVFQVTAQAYTAKGWENLGDAQSLFKKGEEAPVGVPLTLAFTDLPSDFSDSTEPADWGSYLRLVLGEKTFLHQEYWQCVGAGNGCKLNPPYTPQWSSLDICYGSTQVLDDASQYLLTPFGYQPASAKLDNPPQPQLYLGFSAMQPGQQLSLFWKLQSSQPLSVDWQYLNQKNQWGTLNADVLDGTGGLFESGLWSATLPADAYDQAAQMPAGKHWLRGVITATAPSMSETVSDYPQLQGLLVNAMTATLSNSQAVAVDHFDQPLPAGSVVQTVEAVDGIDGVLQPWPSQGAKAPETLARFNSRVARQLSHRGRALRREDSKTMLLEQFPEVYDVILPAVEGEQAAATVALTVIPAPGRQDNNDPLRPVFGPARLERMQQYLLQRSSPWMTLTVKNPTYVCVPIDYTLTFIPDISPEYGEQRLKQLLSEQYMPWAMGASGQVGNGKQLDYYKVLAFIQQQSFVHKVDCLKLNGCAESVGSESNQVLVLTWPELPVA